MGKKKNKKKLSLKKQAVRKLDALTEDQLGDVGGGYETYTKTATNDSLKITTTDTSYGDGNYALGGIRPPLPPTGTFGCTGY